MRRALLGALVLIAPWVAAQTAEPGAASARPQLDAAAAARAQVTDYLAQGPSPWRPVALREIPLWRADFTVAADGSGTHRTVQAAVDAVPARGTSSRRYSIRVQPGVYRETLCVRDKAPLTLFGAASDAAGAVIVEGRYNALPKRPGVDAAHPCHPDFAAATHGTPGSATAVVASDDVQIVRLTIANDSMDRVRDGVGYPVGAGESGGAQGVALMTQGDRVQLERVRLLGHQDTFFARRAAPDATARVHVRNSLIAGDVDFIFGNATLVIDDSTVLSRAGRRMPGNGGHVLAPSTPATASLGMLVTGSRFEAEPGVASGSISLGRAWDEAVPRGEWRAGSSPNGQALVRDSLLGPHIGPWATSTSRRPFAATGDRANRMAEHGNAPMADPGAVPRRALARDALVTNDGWAAADGGTRGGAAAALQDVFEVRTRAELVAALAPHARPRIVQIRGQIDLSTADDGRPLGFEDYRDAQYDRQAFVQAYDVATWGRKPPAGPLEDARQRSARRQAERVVIRVPSNTTLIGLGRDAQLVGGMVLLERVDNVIVRNLHFSDAYDHFPAWDPNDNAQGEWNSEYDNLSLRHATHVWVDHCSFDDGQRPDSAEPFELGRRVQRYDGLLDITRESNHITVSWNIFRHHDKTTLVGAGDGQRQDDGRLKVSFHHNLWQNVHERAPRVRYGQVHVHDNLYVGQTGGEYPFGYSLGVGVQSRIVSERNVWETTADITPARLTRWWKGSTFLDRGSIHNGQPVDLLGALRQANPSSVVTDEVGWVPPYVAFTDAVSEVAPRVRAGAGAGRLAVGAD